MNETDWVCFLALSAVILRVLLIQAVFQARIVSVAADSAPRLVRADLGGDWLPEFDSLGGDLMKKGAGTVIPDNRKSMIMAYFIFGVLF